MIRAVATHRFIAVWGRTYNIRQTLKAMGFRWDAANREWRLNISGMPREEARAVLAALTDIGVKSDDILLGAERRWK